MNPSVTLEIPTDEDVEIIIELLENEYESVRIPYEQNETLSENVARRGSLCQELFAQLSNQGFSRYD